MGLLFCILLYCDTELEHSGQQLCLLDLPRGPCFQKKNGFGLQHNAADENVTELLQKGQLSKRMITYNEHCKN